MIKSLALFIRSSQPLSMVVGLVTGLAFGICLERSQMFQPNYIKDQMLLQNFTMVKVFMTAVATGMLIHTLLYLLNLVTLSKSKLIWKRNLIGGLIIGLGFTICGACPGTVFAQIGTGTSSSLSVLIGGLAGALAYGLIEPFATKLLPATSETNSTIYAIFNLPYHYIAIPMSVAMMLFLVFLESWRSWTVDLASTLAFDTNIWNPYFAGIVIGLLQLPTMALMGFGLSTSTAYVIVVSKLMSILNICTGKSENCNKTTYLQDAGNMKQPKNAWQPFADLGIIIGAFYSATYMSSSFTSINFSNLLSFSLTSFIGGFVLIFGARLANGCTSGHGLTGMAKLETGSIIAVCAMFAGGIGSSFLLQSLF